MVESESDVHHFISHAVREMTRIMPRAERGGLVTGHYAYLLRCGDGSYYAGYAVDPVRRLRVHREGRASRYTRGRGPYRLVAVWRCPTRSAALRLERTLKRLPHAAKRRLASGGPIPSVSARAAELGARRQPRGRGMPIEVC